MSSSFKKAHKTHALAQPAGVGYPHTGQNSLLDSPAGSADGRLLQRFQTLCALVQSVDERAGLLGVSAETDAAWQAGKALPLLRAHRKALDRALADVSPE